MAAFVLVHGGWAGSVVWRQLVPRLRKAGHEVYAPTLTSIGARKHLLNREIGLDTHIQDVIGVVDDADLSDIVLVGHSYGGMVISGVADRVPEKVASLVYLDGFERAILDRSEPNPLRYRLQQDGRQFVGHFKLHESSAGQGVHRPTRIVLHFVVELGEARGLRAQDKHLLFDTTTAAR